MNEDMKEESPFTPAITVKDCLKTMSVEELYSVMLAFLPVIKIDENPTPQRCRYMIGTLSGSLLIRANKMMLRVGGGFMSLEEHIIRIGPFECIKIL